MKKLDLDNAELEICLWTEHQSKIPVLEINDKATQTVASIKGGEVYAMVRFLEALFK